MSHGRIVKTKFMIYWKNKVEMGIEKVVIERAHQAGKKNKNR